ncbi:hypothetical protein DICVIV_11128 [Dictyocaulus viviparus]|uniref:Uncharacterized protein n=1 Tax=Dictyocaulus viviparus TaxID=29172 RepID=A0A0D8XGM4_DICVI|nr:hypothetical protein DICVIV_11128 [Dictyocaulus viviparus]
MVHLNRLVLCKVTADVMSTCFKILGIREISRIPIQQYAASLLRGIWTVLNGNEINPGTTATPAKKCSIQAWQGANA